MIVPVMAISNLVLTQQIYSEETNGAHAHYREPVPLNLLLFLVQWPTPGVGVGRVPTLIYPLDNYFETEIMTMHRTC